MSKKLVYLLALSLYFTACQIPSPYYQKVEAIPHTAWNYSFTPKFAFNIKDTMGIYTPYFIIRHTQAYPYCNLWVLIYIKIPGDSVAKRQRININLAEPNGKWLGRGMGEIYEERVCLNFGDSVKFNKPGTYEIKLEQNMRIDPLPEVMQVGFRIEKTGIRNAPQPQH